MKQISEPIVEIRDYIGSSYNWSSKIDVRSIVEISIHKHSEEDGIIKWDLTTQREGGIIREYCNLDPASVEQLEEVWRIHRENIDKTTSLL